MQRELLYYLLQGKLFQCSFSGFVDCMKHSNLSDWFASVGEPGKNDIGMLYLALQED